MLTQCLSQIREGLPECSAPQISTAFRPKQCGDSLARLHASLDDEIAQECQCLPGGKGNHRSIQADFRRTKQCDTQLTHITLISRFSYVHRLCCHCSANEL